MTCPHAAQLQCQQTCRQEVKAEEKLTGQVVVEVLDGALACKAHALFSVHCSPTCFLGSRPVSRQHLCIVQSLGSTLSVPALGNLRARVYEAEQQHTGDDGLHEEAEHGEHSQAAVLDLLHLRDPSRSFRPRPGCNTICPTLPAMLSRDHCSASYSIAILTSDLPYEKLHLPSCSSVCSP